MGNIESKENTWSGVYEDSAHQLFSITDESNSVPEPLDVYNEAKSNFDRKNLQSSAAIPLNPLQKMPSVHSNSVASSTSSERSSLNQQPTVSPKPGSSYLNRMNHVNIEKKVTTGKLRRNVIRGHNQSSSLRKKAFILSPPSPSTIKTGVETESNRLVSESIPDDHFRRDAFLSLSVSPYSFVMFSKEMIEAKSQLRLMESRQATNLLTDRKSRKMNPPQDTTERDSMHSSSSSTTSATSLMRTQSESKAFSSSKTSAGSLQQQTQTVITPNELDNRMQAIHQVDSCSQDPSDLPQSSVNARNIRRATYNKSVIEDLCNIIADLSMAESKLLAAQSNAGRDLSSSSLVDLIGPAHLHQNIDKLGSEAVSDHVGSWQTNPKNPDVGRKRAIVMREVREFLENFPMRYSFSIQSPSEVLVHMRLVGVARSDEYRAAVHIVKIEKRKQKDYSGRCLDFDSNNVRLVTISCSDRNGLLEYITKLLSSCGSRVLDADVMTTRDNIALDRFKVEMNGRLRLDKLQELIEEYLRETRPSKESNRTQEQDSEPESKDRYHFTSSGEKETSNKLGTLMPIYIKVPRPSNISKKASVAAELENAVPFSDLLSNGRCNLAQGQLLSVNGSEVRLDTYQHQTQDSEDSTNDRSSLAASNSRELKLIMHRSISLPISLLSRTRSSTASCEDKVKSDYGRTSPLNADSSASRSTEEHQDALSYSHSIGQATGECANESELHGSRRRSLVNREAVEFSIGSHQSAEIPEQSVHHGLLATVLEQQSVRTVPSIAADDLMILERLSTGRISSIYRGVWMSRSKHNAPYQVALKVGTMKDTSSFSELEELRREADIASQLQHYNLCELKGICHTPDTFCLAYEYCDGGSLMTLLSDASRCYEYLPIAMDVANGMAYLHSRNVIHRDINPSNVLLTLNNRAKVSDFGLSVTNRGQELTAETGTYRWMAPEVIRHESYSSNADVYSFGVVLWQLITRSVPFATMTPIQTAYAVAHGHRPEIDPSTPRELRKLIEYSWNEDSQKRPSFTYIAMALADYACRAFSPANVGAQTVMIANEIMAKVEGNSTVNVDFSTPFMTPQNSKILSNPAISPPSEVKSNSRFMNEGLSSYSSFSNIGLEI